MTWEKKRITVVAKAYPEPSVRHGCVACTAGITDTGEWIRLYPIDVRYFSGNRKISKYDVIEVECRPDHDKLGRKESYKIRQDTITIVDRSLNEPRKDWDARNRVILPLKVESVDALKRAYEKDRTSIGLLRPRRLIDFVKTGDLEIPENDSWSFVTTIDGERIPSFKKMDHIFKYHFKCDGEPEETLHQMQCEDWELFESYRTWGRLYHTPEKLWSKLRAKYLGWMLGGRDLHFVMGMYSRYPVWFIIGIYYPPRKKGASGPVLGKKTQARLETF